MAMKTILCVFLYINIIFSQIDTLSLSFYPLNTGDYWEYKNVITVWDFYYPPTTDTNYYSIEVIGDSVMPNSQTYKIIQETELSRDSISDTRIYFERVDSITCNVYKYYEYAPNEEYLIDSLKSLQNDTSKASHDLMFGYRGPYAMTVCQEVSLLDIFGDLHYAKYFRADVLDGFQYWLVQNIGFYSFQNSFDFGNMDINLQYASVNGIVYGEKVNRIENKDVNNLLPEVFLYQNYPNPFNSKTNIQYHLAKSENIEMVLYTINGEKVYTILKSFKSAGNHSFVFDGDNLSSGIYIYTLRTKSHNYSKKFILLK